MTRPATLAPNHDLVVPLPRMTSGRLNHFGSV